MIGLLIILISVGLVAYGVCIVAMWFMDLIDVLVDEHNLLNTIYDKKRK